ncbi:MAG: MBL fold metallo-hydrolase [Magnetococcales bacterium]|nr:MBL fold metallo-hydrolase [Magnetococcales bacterium]
MKIKIEVFTLLVTLFFVQTAFAELSKLADNVYTYVDVKDASPAHSFAANAGIIIGRDGVMVVDTLISAKEGKRFLSDIRKITKKPIKYVINTHAHLDHAFGNSVFAKQGATVISHETERTTLATKGVEILNSVGNYGLKPEDMAGTKIVVPTMAFSEKLLIDLGDVEIQLIRFAPSHTAGSVVVYLPKHKLLFAGDILFTDFHPFLADGDFNGWSKTIDSLLAMDVERIIPGHGPLSSKKDLQEMQAYLTLFDTTARELVAQNMDAEAMTAELVKRLPKRTLAEWMIGYNLKARYLGKK